MNMLAPSFSLGANASEYPQRTHWTAMRPITMRVMPKTFVTFLERASPP